MERLLREMRFCRPTFFSSGFLNFFRNLRPLDLNSTASKCSSSSPSSSAQVSAAGSSPSLPADDSTSFMYLYCSLVHMHQQHGLCNGRTHVRPSVCLSRRSTEATAAGGFAAERPAGSRYRSIAAGALQASCCRRLGAQQQMRVASCREPTEESL